MKYRIGGILFVVGIIFIYISFPCLKLYLLPTPGIITENKDVKGVIVLFGHGVCGTCPTGSFINSMKDDPQLLYVLPSNFNSYEMDNFKRGFQIKGKIIKGNQEFYDYLKALSACHEKYEIESNIFITLNSKGKIEKIEKI